MEDISKFQEHSKNLLEVMEVMESDVLPQAVSRILMDSSQDSEVHQHSKNSLNSAAGVSTPTDIYRGDNKNET